MGRRLIRTVFLLSISLLAPSWAASAHAISVYILNSLQPSEPGAVLEITSVKGIGVSGNQKMLVMPGEKKRVYARHVTGFVLSRVYGDFKTLYDVKCPEDVRIKDVLIIGLSEIQKNTVGAGCEVIREGKWTLESGTSWQQKKK